MRSCITSEALHHGLQGLTRVAAQPAFAGILLASCPLASHGAPPPGTVNGTSSLSTVIHHAASQERDLVAAEATVSRVGQADFPGTSRAPSAAPVAVSMSLGGAATPPTMPIQWL